MCTLFHYFICLHILCSFPLLLKITLSTISSSFLSNFFKFFHYFLFTIEIWRAAFISWRIPKFFAEILGGFAFVLSSLHPSFCYSMSSFCLFCFNNILMFLHVFYKVMNKTVCYIHVLILSRLIVRVLLGFFLTTVTDSESQLVLIDIRLSGWIIVCWFESVKCIPVKATVTFYILHNKESKWNILVSSA